MPEWLLGFVLGVIATLIGFSLTMAWDIFKNRREEKKKQKTTLLFIHDELDINLNSLKNNQDLIEKELKVIDEGKTVNSPLLPFKDSFWDVVKINLPNGFDDPKKFSEIRVMAHLISLINETIRSRENFRIMNKTLDTYNPIMRNYDESLLIYFKRLEELYKLIDINEKNIENQLK